MARIFMATFFDRHNPVIVFNLALVLELMGHLADAEEAYRLAIEKDPTYVEPYNNLATLIAGQGKTAEAEQLLRAALKEDPEDPRVWNNLGLVLQAQQRLAEAETSFRKALGFDPAAVIARLNLVDLLRKQGRDLEANEVLREEFLANSLSLDFRRHLEKGETTFVAKIKLNPNDALSHLNLAVVLELQGRWDEAEAAYRKALALGQKDPQPFLWLAELLKLQRNFSQARRVVLEGLKRHPGHLGLKQSLDKLMVEEEGRSVSLVGRLALGSTLEGKPGFAAMAVLGGSFAVTDQLSLAFLAHFSHRDGSNALGPMVGAQYYFPKIRSRVFSGFGPAYNLNRRRGETDLLLGFEYQMTTRYGRVGLGLIGGLFDFMDGDEEPADPQFILAPQAGFFY